MGSIQDAMNKAGLSSDADTPVSVPEPAVEKREEHRERKPRGERPPRAERAFAEKPAEKLPEKLDDKPCAKCGTVFTPRQDRKSVV